MITINHCKTYTLDCEITKRDESYSMFNEAYENHDNDPWLHTDEIFKLIEKEIRPLVPFKKVGSYGYRLIKWNNGTILMKVTFDLNEKKLDIIH